MMGVSTPSESSVHIVQIWGMEMQRKTNFLFVSELPESKST